MSQVLNPERAVGLGGDKGVKVMVTWGQQSWAQWVANLMHVAQGGF